MHSHRRLALISICAVLTGEASTTQAQSGVTLNELMIQRDAAIRQIQTAMDAQKSDIFDKYANALDTLHKQFTARGDLDSLLIVKNEIESARMKRTLSGGVLPALDNHRSTLRKNLAVIESATAKSQAQIDGGYIRSLNQLKIDLTKAGQVEDAIAVDKEMKNVTSGRAPTATATAPPAPVPAPIGSGGKAVDLEKPITGEITLPTGDYRLKKRLDVGASGKNKATETPGTLHCLPGTEFASTTLFVRKGLLSVDRTQFKECKLMVDLSGTVKAKDSIFSECVMEKAGVWYVDIFSSKWIFENCVFSRSFIPVWKINDVGTKITRCTFHDIDFGPLIYKADAGKEVAMEWLDVRQCKFIGCLIPESLFLATKDCVFEDCRFQAAKDKVPVATPIKVRAYVSNPISIPASPSNCTYEILDPKLASKDTGSDLRYQKLGRSIRFQ